MLLFAGSAKPPSASISMSMRLTLSKNAARASWPGDCQQRSNAAGETRSGCRAVKWGKWTPHSERTSNFVFARPAFAFRLHNSARNLKDAAPPPKRADPGWPGRPAGSVRGSERWPPAYLALCECVRVCEGVRFLYECIRVSICSSPAAWQPHVLQPGQAAGLSGAAGERYG